MVKTELNPDIRVFRVESLGFLYRDQALLELAPSSEGRGGHKPQIAKYVRLGGSEAVVDGCLGGWRWRWRTTGRLVKVRVNDCGGD